MWPSSPAASVTTSSLRHQFNRNCTMTRAYALLASLILIASPLAGCLTGEDIEEIIDDILGCIDENAENYDENATAELVGECIYLASMEAFITAMADSMDIDAMLEKAPRAGYSYHLISDEWNDEAGQITIDLEKIVKVDLGNDSVYTKMHLDISSMIVIDYEVTQVGEVVNVASSVGGQYAGMVPGDAAGTSNVQTRDADPNILDLAYAMEDSTGEETVGDSPGDLFDELPVDAQTNITWDSAESKHTLVMEFVDEETGHDVRVVIGLDEGEELLFYSMTSSNNTDSMQMDYTVMWEDAIVIEVDETLPRTSLPISWEGDEEGPDEGGEDVFVCDDGQEIPAEWENDGEIDCSDGSDESDDGEPESCGGFVGTTCPDGYTCVDDPNDDCDPENGGADCLGICVEEEEEWTMNHFWGCGLVVVNADSLDDWEDQTIISALSTRPDYPDWCGEVIGIDDLPPSTTDAVATLASGTQWASHDYASGQSYIRTLNETEETTYILAFDEMECSNSSLIWFEDDAACGTIEQISLVSDDELIVTEYLSDGSMVYWRYELIGNHLFIGELNPTTEEPEPEPQEMKLIVAESQVFNAPISDFEIHGLDCSAAPIDYDDEGNPLPADPNDCSEVESANLGMMTGTWVYDDGSWASFVYNDNDGDGLISAGDSIDLSKTTDAFDSVEFYDTWADEYVSQSKAASMNLPGFGALLGTLGLLGAALAGRRD